VPQLARKRWKNEDGSDEYEDSLAHADLLLKLMLPTLDIAGFSSSHVSHVHRVKPEGCTRKRSASGVIQHRQGIHVASITTHGSEVSPQPFLEEGRNKQIYAFDKHTGREFCANVQKVAAETEFYDIVGEVPHSLEAGLSEIESLAAPILTTILKNESLAELNPRNRRILAAFCASNSCEVSSLVN